MVVVTIPIVRAKTVIVVVTILIFVETVEMFATMILVC